MKRIKLADHVDRKLADSFYRLHFGAFCYAAFETLNPGQRLVENWHIDLLCFQLQKMVTGESQNRIVINPPPRTLKSLIISVMLTGWLLGRDPGARIICASYSEELAFKFSRDARALMESPFFKRVFPHTRLNPKKTTERELETTRRGYRLAASIGGTLTGRGGDVLIIDDPTKANDANSVLALANAIDWFRNTAMSRLDNPASSLIIITMQRLHVKDLSGVSIEAGWPSLVLPAIATETVEYLIGEDRPYRRVKGELLQPSRDSLEAFKQLEREMGSRVFAAQYQQNPMPVEGNIIKAAWLVPRYDFPPCAHKLQRVVLACDPASKAGPDNDYTAIVICGFDRNQVHVLHADRGHWSILRTCERIKELARDWIVDRVIIEDTSSGPGLIHILRKETLLNVIGRHPTEDKVVRMSRHEARFEAGNVLLPKEAPWLSDLESEILAFPNGRYDDWVDALLLFLDWPQQRERWDTPVEDDYSWIPWWIDFMKRQP